jgi:hypothetical protein
MTTYVGGAPEKSAPHLTRTISSRYESLSSIYRHPAFLVLVAVLGSILLVAFPALKLVVIGFLLRAVTR